MKRIRGSSHGQTDAGRARIRELLANLEAYPAWNPKLVHSVGVLDCPEEGQANQFDARLSVWLGPLRQDLGLILALTRDDPDGVTLSRVPYDPQDLEEFEARWQLEPAGSGKTRIRLDVDAYVDVPRLLPVAGLGDRLARDFVEAAVSALR